MNWQPFSPDIFQPLQLENSVSIFYGSSFPLDSPFLGKQLTAGEIERLRTPTITQRDRTKAFGRVARMHLLSIFLRLEPLAINLFSNAYGRPYVKGSLLDFSSSYSDSGYLIGITSSGSMGIDLENPDVGLDLESVATYFFSENEFRNFQNDPDQFYFIWTKKEALFKTSGTGIPELPNEVDANDLLKKMNLTSHSFLSPRREPSTVVVPTGVRRIQFFTLDESL